MKVVLFLKMIKIVVTNSWHTIFFVFQFRFLFTPFLFQKSGGEGADTWRLSAPSIGTTSQ
jgi:hypothetical protein